jgi:pimeloyl-ACP methyl ester carboxylesterase
MYYEIHGYGKPLVLISGLGTDHTLFRFCVARLYQIYKVLIFDNRGAGNTNFNSLYFNKRQGNLSPLIF